MAVTFSSRWIDRDTRASVNPDSIPRYAPPDFIDDDEPEFGACWNCGHAADVFFDGKLYAVCVASRDLSGEGDVMETDTSIRDCPDWGEG